MRHFIGFTVGLSCCALLAGCQPAVVESTGAKNQDGGATTQVAQAGTVRASTGGVAVIDLKELARLTGERERLQVAISKRESDLNDRLALLSSGYGEEVEKLRKSYGDEPTEAQQAEISTKIGQFNASILEQRERARQEFSEFKTALESEYLQQIRPVALQVAEELGYSVVLQRSLILASSDAADITTQTVERLEATTGLAVEKTREPSVRAAQQLNGGGQFKPIQ